MKEIHEIDEQNNNYIIEKTYEWKEYKGKDGGNLIL